VLLEPLNLRVPRPGPVDPDRCPVCARLRDNVATVVITGSRKAARGLVTAMRTHMVHGHPKDPRTVNLSGA
jgi:hypothetical protein